MATKPKPIPALSVVSRSPMGVLRRAGREWSAKATLVAAKDLTKEQLAALRAEPLLVVTETEMTADEAAGAETA